MTDVKDMGLPTRTTNALSEYGLKTAESIQRISRHELTQRIPGIAKGGVAAIDAYFEKHSPMTDELEGAPETIWVCYPLSGERKHGTIYGYDIEYFDPTTEVDEDFDDPCASAAYTRKDIADKRIAELEAVLLAMVEAEVEYMTVNQLGDPEKQHNIKWARRALKATTT